MKKNVCVCHHIFTYIFSSSPLVLYPFPLQGEKCVCVCVCVCEFVCVAAVQISYAEATCWGTNQFNCWHFGLPDPYKEDERRRKSRQIADSSAAGETTAKLITKMRAQTHIHQHVHTLANLQDLGQKSVWEISAECTEHFSTAEGASLTQNRQLPWERCCWHVWHVTVSSRHSEIMRAPQETQAKLTWALCSCSLL